MHTLLIFVITQPYKVAPYQVKTRHGLLINAVIYFNKFMVSISFENSKCVIVLQND